MFKVKKKFVFFIGWLGFIILTISSLASTGNDPQIIPHLDKIIHFSAYFGISFYWKQITENLKELYLFSLIWGYSILIEIIQPLTNRSFDYLDILANFFGVIAGISISQKIKVLKTY